MSGEEERDVEMEIGAAAGFYVMLCCSLFLPVCRVISQRDACMGYVWKALLALFPCIPYTTLSRMHDVKRLIHPAQTIHNLASTSLLHGTMALPYDATPPPEDTLPPAPAPAPRLEALDLPLDDCPPAVPPHVQSLMSRMSSSKVYLVDESPAILHLDGHARLREPAVRRLVKQLDSLGDDGLQSWLDGLARESGVGVKGNAVYLSSELIQHLSTSKIFSWATGLGAQPMGMSISLCFASTTTNTKHRD